MKKSIKSLFLAFVLLMVLLNGCAPAPTPNAPESISWQSHEIYAGLTNDPSTPFVMIHETGETLAMTQTGAVWVSPDGTSIVIYSDEDGNLTGVVVGEQVILFSNYTANTVDVTIIKKDGTIVTAQSKLDKDVLQKIKSFNASPDSMISFSNSSLRQQDFDKWFWMETGLYMLEVGTCTAGVLSATTSAPATAFVAALLPGTALALGRACTGALLGTLKRVGTILDIDVGSLESLGDIKALDGCYAVSMEFSVSKRIKDIKDIADCVESLIPVAKEQEAVASTSIASNPNYAGLQQGTFDFDRLNTSTPTPKPTATLPPPPTRTPIPTSTPRPVPTRTSQPISSPQGMLCGQYTHIDIPADSSNGIGWTRLIFVTSNNKVFGLSVDIPEGYYRIYDTVIDWTPVTYGDGTQADGSITSLSAYEPISSLQSCQQTQQQPPAQPSTSAQQAQISNEVYFAALRQSPGYSNKDNAVDLLAEIPAGDIVQILGGPKQADGLNWWNVSWNGTTGWLADHTGSGKTIMIFLP